MSSWEHRWGGRLVAMPLRAAACASTQPWHPWERRAPCGMAANQQLSTQAPWLPIQQLSTHCSQLAEM